MSDLIETIISEPRLLFLFVVSIAIGVATGSWFGLMPGLHAFAISFVTIGLFMMVRSWSRRR